MVTEPDTDDGTVLMGQGLALGIGTGLALGVGVGVALGAAFSQGMDDED